MDIKVQLLLPVGFLLRWHVEAESLLIHPKFSVIENEA